MNIGLYRSAVALSQHEARLDAIAGNLANLSTVGFKRNLTATQGIRQRRPSGPVQGLTTRTSVDFTQGNLLRTGRDMDLALFGDGFFVVDGPTGELYTRAGSFQLTEEGVLTSEDGYPVSWTSNNRPIDPSGAPIQVDEEGNVRQGNDSIGQLRLAAFADKSRLRLAEDRYWVAAPNTPESTVEGKVQQYTLEASNATGVEEMVAMIALQRSFDSMRSVFQGIEQTYRRLTR